MNVGTGIILGLLIGALAMLLADWFFYRNRRVCPEAEEELRETNSLLVNERDNLKRQVKSFDGQAARVGTLEADLDTRSKQYNLLLSDHEEATRRYRDLEARFKSNEDELGRLQAALDARDGELNELNVGLEEMGLVAGGAAGGAGLLAALRSRFADGDDDSEEIRAALEARDAEIATLRAELDGRDIEIGDLRGQVDGELGDLRSTIDARDSELVNLRAELDAREIELGDLRGQMDEWNVGLEEMGIAAGGAIGGAGLLAALRSRIGERDGASTELNASLAARDAELEGLRLQLAERDVAFSDLSATVAAQSAEINSLRGALELANVSLDETTGKPIEVTALSSKLDDVRLQLADRESALEASTSDLTGLRVDLAAREMELGELNAKLATQSAEINSLRGALELANVSFDETSGGSIELSSLQTKLGDTRGQLSERDITIGELNATVAAQAAELDSLRGALELANVSIGDAADNSAELAAANSANLENLQLTLTERNTEVADLNARIAAQSAELDSLRGALDVANVSFDDVEQGKGEMSTLRLELDSLRGQLAERDSQLAELNAEVDGLDIDWGKMGLAAGGAAAGGGLLARLRGLGRRVHEQEEELAVAPESIELNPYVIELQGSLRERDAELADLRTRWEAQSAELSNLRGELDAARAGDSDLAALRLQLEEREAEIGRIRAEASARSAELQRLNAELEGRSGVNTDIETLRSTLSERDDEILSLRTQLESVDSELGNVNLNWLAGGGAAIGAGGTIAAMNSRMGDLEAQVADRDAQLLAFQQGAVEPDDLTKIWGIGSVIESKLNDSGIYTFEQLARTEQADIDQILAGSGSRFRLATPAIRATWPEQARLAAVNDWDALNLLQTRVRSEKPDQMTRIWGLSDEIERSLATRGIDTYRELEEVSYDEVLPELEMVQANYPHYSKREIYGYWVQQSRWAMQDDWDAIESQFVALATPPEPDDLTKIWGIGAGLEGILNANGIHTFAQLAEAPESRLDEIIEKAGPRYRIATRNLHSTWSAQAEMAAADDWEALQVYQDKLSWSDEGGEQ